MAFFTSLIVLMSVAAAQAANLQGGSVSPSVKYWHEKLPMTAIPDSLAELISPLSTEDDKVAVNVGKGGVSVGVGNPAPKPQPKPSPRGKGVGVPVKPHAEGKGVGVSVNPPAKGGGGVSVRTPGKGVGVHVGTKSPYDYNYAADAEMLADPSLSMFLLEKDLHKGTKVSLQLVQRSISNKAYFLPRGVVDKIPFSSQKLSVALKELDVEQDSDMAAAMKETLNECEAPAIKGESKYCATSLESMIDYTTSELGTNRVNVVVTEVPESSKWTKQRYSITGVPYESEAGATSVVCHRQRYAYAVYYCHDSKDTKTVQVSLKAEGDDGSSAEALAVAVCHADTSAWNPNHVAFQVLNVKPGAAAVCHFIPQDHIVWLPAQAN